MFIEFFNWFCDSLASVFDVMKKFVLFDGFNYYNFVIALFAIPIIIKLIKFIMAIEDEEVNYGYTSDYEQAYDYKPQHSKLTYRYEYIPRHERQAYKGRHGR